MQRNGAVITRNLGVILTTSITSRRLAPDCFDGMVITGANGNICFLRHLILTLDYSQNKNVSSYEDSNKKVILNFKMVRARGLLGIHNQ